MNAERKPDFILTRLTRITRDIADNLSEVNRRRNPKRYTQNRSAHEPIHSEPIRSRYRNSAKPRSASLDSYRPLPKVSKLLAHDLTSLSSLTMLVLSGTALALGNYVDFTIISTLVVAGDFSTSKSKVRSAKISRQVESKHPVKALRNQEIRWIPPTELAAGDVVFLRAGDIIPADGFVLRAQQTRIREYDFNFRTFRHTVLNTQRPRHPLPSDIHQLFDGSQVLSGCLKMKVTEAGAQSSLAKIGKKPKHHETYTEQQYNQLTEVLTKAGWVSCLALGGITIAMGRTFFQGIQIATSVLPRIAPAGFSQSIVQSYSAAMKRARSDRWTIDSYRHADYLEDARTMVLTDHGCVNRCDVSSVYAPYQSCESDEQANTMEANPFNFNEDAAERKSSPLHLALTLLVDNEQASGIHSPYKKALHAFISKGHSDTSGWQWIDESDGQGAVERQIWTRNGQRYEWILGSADMVFNNCSSVQHAESVLLEKDHREMLPEDRATWQKWITEVRSRKQYALGCAYRILEDPVSAPTELADSGEKINLQSEAFNSTGYTWIGAVGLTRSFQPITRMIQETRELGISVKLLTDKGALEDSVFSELQTATDQAADFTVHTVADGERDSFLEGLCESHDRCEVCIAGDPFLERSLYGAVWDGSELWKKLRAPEWISAVNESRMARTRIAHTSAFNLSGNLAEGVYCVILGLMGAIGGLAPIIMNVLTNNLVSSGIASGNNLFLCKNARDFSQMKKHIIMFGLLAGAVSVASYYAAFVWTGNRLFAGTLGFITLMCSELWQSLYLRQEPGSRLIPSLWKDPKFSVKIAGAIGILLLSVYTPLAGPLQLFPLSGYDWILAAGLGLTVVKISAKLTSDPCVTNRSPAQAERNQVLQYSMS